MPWDASDAQRHTHQLKGKRQKRGWAKIANNALAEYGDEGTAIRVANARAKRVRMRKALVPRPKFAAAAHLPIDYQERKEKLNPREIMRRPPNKLVSKLYAEENGLEWRDDDGNRGRGRYPIPGQAKRVRRFSIGNVGKLDPGRKRRRQVVDPTLPAYVQESQRKGRKPIHLARIPPPKHVSRKKKHWPDPGGHGTVNFAGASGGPLTGSDKGPHWGMTKYGYVDPHPYKNPYEGREAKVGKSVSWGGLRRGLRMPRVPKPKLPSVPKPATAGNTGGLAMVKATPSTLAHFGMGSSGAAVRGPGGASFARANLASGEPAIPIQVGKRMTTRTAMNMRGPVYGRVSGVGKRMTEDGGNIFAKGEIPGLGMTDDVINIGSKLSGQRHGRSQRGIGVNRGRLMPTAPSTQSFSVTAGSSPAGSVTTSFAGPVGKSAAGEIALNYGQGLMFSPKMIHAVARGAKTNRERAAAAAGLAGIVTPPAAVAGGSAYLVGRRHGRKRQVRRQTEGVGKAIDSLEQRRQRRMGAEVAGLAGAGALSGAYGIRGTVKATRKLRGRIHDPKAPGSAPAESDSAEVKARHAAAVRRYGERLKQVKRDRRFVAIPASSRALLAGGVAGIGGSLALAHHANSQRNRAWS